MPSAPLLALMLFCLVTMSAGAVHADVSGAKLRTDGTDGPAVAKSNDASDGNAHTIPYFPSASDALGRQGFARIVNLSPSGGTVSIDAFDDGGRNHGPVTLTLDALETVHFNSADLEDGAASKGLPEGTGPPSEGDWRLELTSGLDLKVLAYIRTRDGFVTSMHDVAPSADDTHGIWFFNPGSNTAQESLLRLVNRGDVAAAVSIRGIDDRGSGAPGGVVGLSIPPGAARTLSAADLERGATGLDGALGDGAGKWRLEVDADRPILAISMLATPTGHLTNLSSAPGEYTPLGGGRTPGTSGEGDLRLVGGGVESEGRVEIFHAGEWGTVCDDEWGMPDAGVACRQLGYPGALEAPGRARFGQGTGRIWMDNVRCDGSESRLADCPFAGWGVENCSHGEDASAVCDAGGGGGDDHGDTRSGATPLSPVGSQPGRIETGSDVDFFSVRVPGSGTLTVYSTGSLDTEGELQDDSGSVLASNSDGGTGTNFRIEHAVNAGTYYVKVEGWRSRTGGYTVHADFEEDDGGRGVFGATSFHLRSCTDIPVGIALNRSTERAAVDAASDDCDRDGGGASACDANSGSFTRCGAMTYGTVGSLCQVYSWSISANTRFEAEDVALRECRLRALSECRILTNDSGNGMSGCNSQAGSGAGGVRVVGAASLRKGGDDP